MPVIQLPADNRWGALGAGLGNVATGLLNAYNDKQLGQDVSTVVQDDTVPEAKKPAKILEKFGRKGLEIYDQLKADEQKAAVVTHLLAQTGLTNIQAKAQEAQLPSVGPQAQANVAATTARTELTGAQTAETAQQTARIAALTGPETELTSAKVPLTQAQTGNVQAESRKNAAEASTLEQQNALRALLTGAPDATAINPQGGPAQVDPSAPLAPNAAAPAANVSPLARLPQLDQKVDTILKAFPALTPAQTSAAKSVYADALVKGQNADTALTSFLSSVSRQTKGETPKFNESEVKQAGEESKHAESARRFMERFAAGGAQQIGTFRGAPLVAKLEQWGIPTGNVSDVDMWNSSQQQVASAATAGGGFFAAGRVKLAKDVTSGITETPLHALLATDQVADRQLSALNTRLASLKETNTSSKSTEKAIADWDRVKKITGSFRSEVVPDPRKPDDLSAGRTVAFFQGNQIDPKTFAPLVKNDTATTYDLGKGLKIDGSRLFEAARVKNKDPWQLLQELKAANGR